MQSQLREATRPSESSRAAAAQYLQGPLHLEPAGSGFSFLRDRYQQPLFLLLALAASVLGLACVNAATMLLAQSNARCHEAAVRLALGAGRGQVVREALVESVLVALAGAALALAIGGWASTLLVAVIATPGSGVVLDVSIGPRVLGAAMGLALVTGVGFGAGPALRFAAAAPQLTLGGRSRGVVSGGRLGPGHGLVAVQLAVAFVLVWGAALFGRSLVELTAQPLGFDPSRVLVGTVDLRRTGVTAEQRGERFEQVRQAVAVAPGVEAAALAFLTPGERQHLERSHHRRGRPRCR